MLDGCIPTDLLSNNTSLSSLEMMSTSFAAGVLAYMLATFNGGFLWHLVLFNDMYLSLKVWTRFPENIGLELGASAVLLQVRGIPL